MRLWLLALFALGAALALGVTVFLGNYQRFVDAPLDIPASGHVFRVEAGDTGARIVERLESSGFTRQSVYWRVLMKTDPQVYRAGEFQLLAGMTPGVVMKRLASSEVISYRFTIVEGWTVRQLLERMATNEVLLRTLPSDLDEAWVHVATELALDHPEGWFLPETYAFIRGDSDIDILRRAHKAMQEALASAWNARAEGLPLESPYELLTLASIIEKETALDEEREQIAGVFVRRLQKGMRLQTDPTIIYGIGHEFDGDIKRSDLRTDTPYNTYTRHGLTPTPIALPGKASLFAAGAPDSGTALFFVANGKGGHTFSNTLEEHQAAVRRLLGKSG